MNRIRTFVFVLVALVNLAPVIGVISAGQLASMYDIEVGSADLEILLRHRAILFGMLGVFLLIAAFRPSWQIPAGIAGFISMVSFVLLAYAIGDMNGQIRRVVYVDVGATIALVVVLVSALMAKNRSG